jgi:hypothetical protein
VIDGALGGPIEQEYLLEARQMHLRAALALFVLGTALLVPFEHTVTLVAGVFLLLAWIVVGVFGVATPERLASDD